MLLSYFLWITVPPQSCLGIWVPYSIGKLVKLVVAFCSQAEILGEGLMNHFPPALFLKWRSAHAQQFHFLDPGWLSKLRWSRKKVFPDKLCVSLFPWWVPILCLDSTVSPFRLGWMKGMCMFTSNLPSALSAEWLGSLICYCGNTGVEWIPT